MIPVSYYLWISALLFTTGAIGVLMRRNALIMLMSLELMLNAVNLSFMAYARMWGDVGGHVFVFSQHYRGSGRGSGWARDYPSDIPHERDGRRRSPQSHAALIRIVGTLWTAQHFCRVRARLSRI